MKKICIIAAAVIGLALTAPVTAHHNSPNPDAIEANMPVSALTTHNLAVDAVLDRLEDIGVSGNMDGSTVSNDMDPADTAQGDTCTLMFENDCVPGNDENPSAGMDRGPSTTPLP